MAKVSWNNVSLAPIVYIKAGEEVLAERARDSLVAQAKRAAADTESVRIDASTYRGGELSMIMSPSLFGGGTIAVASRLKEMNEDFLTDAMAYVADPDPDQTLVLIHEGGNRGMKLTKAIQAAKFPMVLIDPIKKDGDKAALLKADAKAAGHSIGDDAVAALVDGLGGDLREMTAALAQLMSDVDGPITAAHVHTYYGGRIEATGFAVADAAIAGREGKALALLRHALATGVSEVQIVAALALKIRQLAGVLASQGSRGARMPNMAPWQIKRVRAELSHWSSEGLADALAAVAVCDGAVKGFRGAKDPDYALEKTIAAICAARRR